LRPYGPDRLPPLEHVHVPGGRKDKEVNHKEVDAIVKKIEDICDDPRYYGKTIGVIPLHVGQGKQAKAINDKLSDKEKSKIKCDVPSSFQGDERDIILLSLVVGPDESPLSETKHNQQRFNVAASRARDQMILFHSVKENDLKENCLRRKLLKFFIDGSEKLERMDSTKEKAADELEKACKNSDRKSRLPKGFKDWFEVDVALELHRKKYKIIPQFEIAKSKFDFAVEGERAIVAVMCDGGKWEGEKKYDEEIKKQRKLERCGWKIFRIRGSAFYADRERCLKPLLDMLKEMGIKPEN
jgi:very-short-patch-repair endonuclease